jgi:hypothetical protein
MKIRFNQNNKNLLINKEQNFKTDAGWDENFQSYEDEVLRDIINPVENYETNRYIHKPYISSIGLPPPSDGADEADDSNTATDSASLFTTTVNTVEQTDIWFHFYFKDSSNNYTLDYKNVGITQTDKLMANLKYSFFRLEFYKTPNNEPPNRSNRRLVFAKNLAPAVGERVTFTNKFEKIYVPVFFGSSMRNKENMYLFWFHDDTVLEETELTGTTFFMSAKFYNSFDGSKVQFANKEITTTSTIIEEQDLYFQVEMDRTNTPTYHYTILEYDGTSSPYTSNRKGMSGDPIKFYEIPTPTVNSSDPLAPTTPVGPADPNTSTD